jgi:hypothetical protein
MGGCAVELDCARRSHLGVEKLAFEDHDPADGQAQERRVYNGICTAFGRQLVLDILTGASAGGINGALLGAAMKAQRRLHPDFVRAKWIELGDFSQLLHETTEEAPRSLMQGKVFHDGLLAAFDAVLDSGGSKAERAAAVLPADQDELAEQIAKLDVTMTDVAGAERTFRDEWGGSLVAREHKARFKFRERDDYTAPELAAAARTSASFPVAFEPWQVSKPAAELAGLKPGTYGIDGGLLDNAPIRAALDLIPGQPASTQVRRYVCYLNADPPQSDPTKGGGREPALKDVVGYVVNLPRVAPFVDQLHAVEAATRRGGLAELIQTPLLTLDLGTLRTTAKALLPAYQRRRTALSLEELLDEPADAAKAAQRLERLERGLPWIPTDLEPPAEGSEWAWGARAAQRILHLLLDLIRPAMEGRSGAGPGAAEVAVRTAIDRQLGFLEKIHEETVEDKGIRGALQQLADGKGEPEAIADGLWEVTEPSRIAIFEAVKEAADAIKAYLASNPNRPLPGRLNVLFPEVDAELGWSPLQRFLGRVLAIEVVRRALSTEADVETAQRLRFVQLTPSAPTPILREKPLLEAEPAEPKDKLTGVYLGHFSGFYRRSWRANDYMWGRLDAAARITEMLLDGVRVADAGGAAGTLVSSLLPPDVVDAPEAARWLIHEALGSQPGEAAPNAAELRPRLRKRIEDELEDAAESAEDGRLRIDRLPFTRAVCVRAAQLEILQDELPVLASESARDSKDGSSSPALQLPLADGMRATIEALRAPAKPLPRQLNDDHEEVSDLGLRTITHSAFVGLSAARAAGAPLSKFFGIVRAPLQAISGSVSDSPLYRCTVALAFWAAALYLTMRFTTAKGDQDTALSDVWSRSVLVSLIAALAVIAIALVPGLRAWRDVDRGRNGLLALALVGTGGVAAALLARYAGPDLDFTNVVFGTGAEQLPDWLLKLALVVAVGLSAVRLPIVGKLAGTWLKSLRNGWQLCLPLILLSATVIVLSAWRVAPLLFDSRWETASAILALFAAPLLVASHLLAPLVVAQARRLIAALNASD